MECLVSSGAMSHWGESPHPDETAMAAIPFVIPTRIQVSPFHANAKIEASHEELSEAPDEVIAHPPVTSPPPSVEMDVWIVVRDMVFTVERLDEAYRAHTAFHVHSRWISLDELYDQNGNGHTHAAGLRAWVTSSHAEWTKAADCPRHRFSKKHIAGEVQGEGYFIPEAEIPCELRLPWLTDHTDGRLRPQPFTPPTASCDWNLAVILDDFRTLDSMGFRYCDLESIYNLTHEGMPAHCSLGFDTRLASNHN
jgi:hypothetical protein